MAKSFACRDIGMDCDFKVSKPDEASLMKEIAKHAKKAHGMKTIDDATMAKIKAAIKDV
ncbi:MAG: DUF1059 domain-containing protein [Candidatus Micrarchaeia archaeon]